MVLRPGLLRVRVKAARSEPFAASALRAGAESLNTTLVGLFAVRVKPVAPSASFFGLLTAAAIALVLFPTILPLQSWPAMTVKLTFLPSVMPLVAKRRIWIARLVPPGGIVLLSPPPPDFSFSRWSWRFVPFGEAGVPFQSVRR